MIRKLAEVTRSDMGTGVASMIIALLACLAIATVVGHGNPWTGVVQQGRAVTDMVRYVYRWDVQAVQVIGHAVANIYRRVIG